MNRILVIAFLLASFTQTNGQDKFVPLDRNYRILVKTESNDPYLVSVFKLKMLINTGVWSNIV